MSNPWTLTEVEVIIADYFEMLGLELNGQKHNKAAHRRKLLKQFNNRTHGSIEKKHQNISAILVEMGIPYIDGYKPLSKYQQLLSASVSAYLVKHPALQRLFLDDAETVYHPENIAFSEILEDAPTKETVPQSTKSEQKPKLYNPAGIDYLEREANNLKLGAQEKILS